MQYRFLGLVLFLFLIVAGCTKNDNLPAGLLYMIIKYGYITEEFSYNKNNLISEVNSILVYRKFYYDLNLKLIKEEFSINRDYEYKFVDPQKNGISGFIDYEYNITGKLTRKLEYLYNGNDFYLYTINTFEYNNEGLISKQLFQFGENPIFQTKTFLYDSNGNVIEEEMWFPHFKTTFEYDSFLNPYIILKHTGSPGINTNKNNIVKIKYFDFNPPPGMDSTTQYQISYKYNIEIGYPTKMVNGEGFIYY